MPSFTSALACFVFGITPQESGTPAEQSAVADLPAVVVPELAAEIRASDLTEHVGFLASDELRGRRTGTPELRRAAEYIAAVLESAGIEPAGDGGGFLQEVPLVSFEHLELPRFAAASEGGAAEDARFGPQFELSIQGEPRSTGPLGIVIARSGEEIPEEAASDRALLVEGSSSEARDWLRARGMEEGRGWGLVVLPGNDAERDREPKPPRPYRLRPATGEGDPPDWVTVHGALKSALFAGERASVELEYHLDTRRIDDPNVLGMIPGAADSPVREQAIVLSAHIDHLGEVSDGADAAASDGDRVFNGADDDASGVACLLELAAALAAEPRPAQTLVFLFATGEEVGLWGTSYYLKHPVIPLERTVLNLNFEMLGRPDPLVGGSGFLWLTGFERSNLGPALRESGLAIQIDPRPDQHFFERSDNIAFVQRGIVGQTLSSFNMHTDYHHTSDEADRLDYEHMESCTRTALQVVRLVAAAGFVPSWADGEPDLRRR